MEPRLYITDRRRQIAVTSKTVLEENPKREREGVVL